MLTVYFPDLFLNQQMEAFLFFMYIQEHFMDTMCYILVTIGIFSAINAFFSINVWRMLACLCHYQHCSALFFSCCHIISTIIIHRCMDILLLFHPFEENETPKPLILCICMKCTADIDRSEHASKATPNPVK